METKNFLSDDTEIYKYIDYQYVDKLLDEHYLHFQEITKWPDMMESFLDKIIHPDMKKNDMGHVGLCTNALRELLILGRV